MQAPPAVAITTTKDDCMRNFTEAHAASQPPAQLELFERRLPKKPYCTDDLESGLVIRGQRWARNKLYIQANPPWLRASMIFDVDRPNAALAWDEALLPNPGWITVNPENGHAHIAWQLDAPVLVAEASRPAPMRYLAAIEGAMRAKMEADPAYSGLITKNPLHAHWRTLVGGHPLTLAELAEYLPDLSKHQPRRGVKVEAFGIGRNVDTFNFVRSWAYAEVRKYWTPPRERGAFVHWSASVVHACRDFTANEHPYPLDYRECYHIATPIAKWTWRHMTPEGLSRFAARLGRRGGLASGRVRRERTKERDSQILAALEAGASQSAAAARFDLSVRQVKRVLSQKGT